MCFPVFYLLNLPLTQIIKIRKICKEKIRNGKRKKDEKVMSSLCVKYKMREISKEKLGMKK